MVTERAPIAGKRVVMPGFAPSQTSCRGVIRQRLGLMTHTERDQGRSGGPSRALRTFTGKLLKVAPHNNVFISLLLAIYI